MRKEHGNRNLQLCQMLLDDGEYNDWVITTAFYSAVHFVEHALFPLVESGVQYQTFNEYWQIKFYPLHLSKHDGKKRLVKKYIYSIRNQYRELCDDCMNSRYSDYDVSNYNAGQAIKKAQAIKTACLKIKP